MARALCCWAAECLASLVMALCWSCSLAHTSERPACPSTEGSWWSHMRGLSLCSAEFRSAEELQDLLAWPLQQLAPKQQIRGVLPCHHPPQPMLHRGTAVLLCG